MAMQNINTGQTQSGTPTQEQADQGWVPVADTTPTTTQSSYNAADSSVVEDTGRSEVNSNIQTLQSEIDQLKNEANSNTAYNQLQSAYNNINTTSSDEEERIRKAGIAAGEKYTPLINESKYQKTQGMGKATIGAGEAGGFMSTQFAGLAALRPVEGGTFIGRGGQLEEVQSAYDRNIANLESQKNAAIQDAESSMRTYLQTGKQSAFDNAQKMYENAKAKASEQWDLLQKKTTALSSAAKAPYELQKMIADANKAQLESAQATINANYDAITSQLTGDPTQDAQLMEQYAGQLNVSPSMLMSTIAASNISRQKEQLLLAISG